MTEVISDCLDTLKARNGSERARHASVAAHEIGFVTVVNK